MIPEDALSNLIGQQLQDHLGPEYNMDWEWGSIFFHDIGVLNIFQNTDLIMNFYNKHCANQYFKVEDPDLIANIGKAIIAHGPLRTIK